MGWCHKNDSLIPQAHHPVTLQRMNRQVLGGQVQLALHTGDRVADPRFGCFFSSKMGREIHGEKGVPGCFGLYRGLYYPGISNIMGYIWDILYIIYIYRLHMGNIGDTPIFLP